MSKLIDSLLGKIWFSCLQKSCGLNLIQLKCYLYILYSALPVMPEMSALIYYESMQVNVNDQTIICLVEL